jgi:hypothetical protein
LRSLGTRNPLLSGLPVLPEISHFAAKLVECCVPVGNLARISQRSCDAGCGALGYGDPVMKNRSVERITTPARR